MNIEKTYNELVKSLKNSQILKNESMKKHTSFKIGGNADLFIKVNSVEDIKEVVKIANANEIPLYVIGNGSNILVKDNGIRGIVVMLCIENYNIKQNDEKVIVTVEAGMKLAKLAVILQKQGISGLEFASRNSWYYWWSN